METPNHNALIGKFRLMLMEISYRIYLTENNSIAIIYTIMNIKDMGVIKLIAAHRSVIWLSANGLPMFFK